LATSFARRVLGALAPHLLLSTGIASTGNPVQGSFDWFDILSTRATSIFDGFQLLDELRTGRTSAVDEIHDS